MVKKIGDKKVEKLTETKSVSVTEAVKQIEGVKSVAGVGKVEKVGAVSGKRRPTTVMTMAEREAYLRMVSEEAEKMLSAGILSKKQADVAVEAVKMAVDSAIIEEPNSKPKSSK